MKEINSIINYITFHIKNDIEAKIFRWARDYSIGSLTRSHSRNTIFSSGAFVPNK